MVESVAVSVVQFEPKPYYLKEENVEYVVEKICALSGADLIVFPELALSNFFEHGKPDSRLSYYEHGSFATAEPSFKRVVDACFEKRLSAVLGFAERSEHEGYLYNSAAVISPDGLVGISRKNHLPLYEKFYFLPGDEPEVYCMPFGKIGVNICYDAFFPESSRILALKGAEVIVNISSVWKSAGVGGMPDLAEAKERYFDLIPVAQAIANQVHFVQANAAGRCYMGESLGTWERLGKSKIVSATGYVLAKAEGNEEAVVSASLTRSALLMSRAGFGFLADRVPWNYGALTTIQRL